MQPDDLQDLVRDALKTVLAMDERTRKIALNSGVLDRMFEHKQTQAAVNR